MERTGEVLPERADQALAGLPDAPLRRSTTLPLLPVV
jgi:hypothetical protein